MVFGKSKKKTATASRSPVPDLWADTVEAPRANVIDPDKAQWWTIFYRVVAWISPPALVLVSLALFVLIGQSMGSKDAPPPPADTASNGQSSPGRAVATVSLKKWLDQKPSPLPNGTLISWDGASPVAKPPAPTGGNPSGVATPAGTDNGIPDAHYEIDHFTLASSDTTFYTASIEVAVDSRPGGGAMAIPGVSLVPLPQAANDGFAQSIPWPGVQKATNAPPAVSTAVQSWANAYLSGNPATLAQAVQDPNPGHSYLPISGVHTVTPSVFAAGALPSGHDMVVQVGLNISWEGQPPPDPAQQMQPGTENAPTLMDVLVSKSDTAAPVVVAWGAPGSGPSLKPYQNAVVGAAPPTNASTNPTPTTTPGG